MGYRIHFQSKKRGREREREEMGLSFGRVLPLHKPSAEGTKAWFAKGATVLWSKLNIT